MKLFELQDRPQQEKNFDRNIMPQIRKGNLQNSPFEFKKGKIRLEKLKPVQSQRVEGMHDKAKKGFEDGSIRPIVIDKNNFIVNGHHRYDVARGLELKKVRVLKVDASIEELINHFTDTASPEPTYEQKMKAKLDSLMETIEASQDISALMKGIEADLKQREKDLKRLPKKSIYSEGDVVPGSFGDRDISLPQLPYQEVLDAISSWEWQVSPIKLSNGYVINAYQEGYSESDNAWILKDPQGKEVESGSDSIADVMQQFTSKKLPKEYFENFDVVDGNFPVQQRDREMQQGIERELERLAQMWWNNDEDPAVEKKLADMGWEVGEDEGSDTPSVFVVEIGDENGNSYISWPIEQLENDVVEATSSPGRVKRAGASCKGSATELRAKAKKYSGEKGKMYHWCANMKAGKKKS
jgi:hypothetical protein